MPYNLDTLETKHLLAAAGVLGVGYLLWRSTSTRTSSSEASSSSDTSKRDLLASESSGCYGGLPRAVGSTDFDGMPPDFREVYEDPMKVKLSDVTSLTKDFAADAAEALSEQARCAGYSVAADKLSSKAAEIRSWTI